MEISLINGVCNINTRFLDVPIGFGLFANDRPIREVLYRDQFFEDKTPIGGFNILKGQHSTPSQPFVPFSERRLLDYPTAASYLSMTTSALRNLVYKNNGPAACRVGKRTFFSPDDLDAFVQVHRRPAPPVREERQLERKKRGRPTIASQYSRN